MTGTTADTEHSAADRDRSAADTAHRAAYEDIALKTDFYEMTMLQSALHDGTAHKKAVFELFARKLPRGRRYGVVAGTERALHAIQNFRFTPEHIRWLAAHTDLNDETLNYLREYRFTGEVSGLKEGDLYMGYSPVLTVESTFGECILLETVLLSIFNHDCAVASAASRMVQAADGLPIIEMGSRRTAESSAPAAARASYLTGFAATSNVQAGYDYGVTLRGTSAHAFTLAHDTEADAFTMQVASHGAGTTLLVDTYDISEGIDNAITAAGQDLGGIRIDSGDLYEETVRAREQLDAAGNTETKIVLSSDIDEYVIAELVERGIPVDSIGAGTRVVTGSGHPTAGMVYKLVAIESTADDGTGYMREVSKKSEDKISVGGKKRLYRDDISKQDYIVVGDYPVREDERTLHSAPMTSVFIRDGEIIFSPTLEESREHHRAVMHGLTETEKSVQAGSPVYTVTYIGNDV